MALEDLVKLELPVALGLGAALLIASRLIPQLRPQLKAAVGIGLALVGESEAEAEAGIIERLAGRTLSALAEAMSAPPGDPAAHAEVDRTLRRFHHRARVHARRWAHDPVHVGRHYRRHVRHLRDRLKHEWQSRPGGDPQRYERILSELDDDLSG